MILPAVVAQLADLGTFLVMGAGREANPLVVALADVAGWLPAGVKLALLVGIVAYARRFPRLGRIVMAVALVAGSLGAATNVWTIAA